MKKIMILLGSIFCVWMLASCPDSGNRLKTVPKITIANESSVDFSIRFHAMAGGWTIYKKYGDYIPNSHHKFDWIGILKTGSEAVVPDFWVSAVVPDSDKVDRLFLIQLENTVVYLLQVRTLLNSSAVRYSITDEILEQLKTVETPFVLSEKEVKVAPFSKGKESLTFLSKKDFGRIHLWDFQPNAMTSEKQFESFLLEPPAAGEPSLYFLKGDELFFVREGDPTPKKINIP